FSTAFPGDYANVPPETYTLGYCSSGPAGATFTNITPSATQTITAGSDTTWTFNFKSAASTGTAHLRATLDGNPWNGTLSFTAHVSCLSTPFPSDYPATTLGTYILGYCSGGPPSATFTNITPSTTQTITAGSDTTWTFNFKSAPPTCTYFLSPT